MKKTAIISALAGIILVIALVLYFDRGQENARGKDDSGAISRENDASAAEKRQEDPNRVGKDLTAFLRDESFFDPEESALDRVLNRTKQLSLSVTSLERDLRVQVLDPQKEPVQDAGFVIKVKNLGEYKDLDQDGFFYIGDLAPGEYELELLCAADSDYRVPTYPTRVQVRSKLDYTADKNGKFLIRQETEIDEESEDTGVKSALKDADKTEIKKLQKEENSASVGIDVSKENGVIDWDKVKKAGVDFAIVRAGYRGASSGVIVEDPCFGTNMAGASSSLLQKGVCFFSQATSEVEAVEEASAVLSLIGDYKLDYPVFLCMGETEGESRTDFLDKEERTSVCLAFSRTIANAGYTAGIYASRYWLNQMLEVSRLSGYKIWLAEYRDVPLYQGYYDMWQYTSQGKVDGIAGSVDLNISYE